MVGVRAVGALVAVLLGAVACSGGERVEQGSPAGMTTTAPTEPASPSGSVPSIPVSSTSVPSTSVPSTPPTSTSLSVLPSNEPDAVPPPTEPPDTSPPPLEISDPVSGARVDTREYRFVGTTEPGATVLAAGLYPVPVDEAGGWSIVLVMEFGDNIASFEATDAAGNTSGRDVAVHYEVSFSELIVGRWGGPVTVPPLWGPINDFRVEFRVDGTYSVSSSGAPGFYYGSNLDDPNKLYAITGSYPDGQPGSGTLRITWGNPNLPNPRTVGDLTEVRFSENGDQLHLEFWAVWSGRYGPVVYDLSRVSDSAA